MRRMMRSTLAICSILQCSEASLRIASSLSWFSITPRTSCPANPATSSGAAFSAAWYARTSAASSPVPSTWKRTLSASSRAWWRLPTAALLRGEGDARDEDVHLADLETEHSLGRFHDVGLHRRRHIGELCLRIHRDEHLEMD